MAVFPGENWINPEFRPESSEICWEQPTGLRSHGRRALFFMDIWRRQLATRG